MKKPSKWFGPALITVIVALALWIPHYFINTSQQTVVLTITLFAILWYTWETRRMQTAVRDQAKAAGDQIREITKQTEAIAKQTESAASQTSEIVAQTKATTNQTEAIINQTKELIYQRRLSILPKFSIDFARRQPPFPDNIFDCLGLVNIGNGTGVNITVDDIQVRYEEEATALITFERVLFLVAVKSSSTIEKIAWVQMFIQNENSSVEMTADVAEVIAAGPAKFLHKYLKEEKITIIVRFQDIDGTKYSQTAILGLDKDMLYPIGLGVPQIQSDNFH